MKKLLVLISLLALTLFSNFAFAASQVGNSHKLGVGIQFGFPGNGLSFNYFLNEKNSLQISPSFWVKDDWQGIGSRFDYLYWTKLPSSLPFANFLWYVGPGFNFYSVTWRDHNNLTHDDYFSLGVELAAGIGLRFFEVPLDLNLELIPIINLIEEDGTGIYVHLAASLNIRYYF